MHGCVHAWTIHVLNQEWDYEMAGVALGCVGSHVPDEDMSEFWVTQRRLVGHAAFSHGRLIIRLVIISSDVGKTILSI